MPPFLWYDESTKGTEVLNERNEVNAQAEDMFTRLVKERASKDGVNERLKAEDQMRWVHKMNRIRAEAREIVNVEMIFG